MKIANLSLVSFNVARRPFHAGISKHTFLVFFVQSFELLQHKQSQFAIEVRVLHKLKQLGVLFILGQFTCSRTRSLRALRCSSNCSSA